MKTPHASTHTSVVVFCEYKGSGRPFLLGELANAIDWSADHTQQFVDYYVHVGKMREGTPQEKLRMGFFTDENSVYVWI